MSKKVLLFFLLLNLFLLQDLKALILEITIYHEDTKRLNLFKCGRFKNTDEIDLFIRQIYFNLKKRWNSTWAYYENNKSKLYKAPCVINAMESLKNWIKIELEWNDFLSICINNGDVSRFRYIGEADSDWQNPLYYYGKFKIWDIWGPAFKFVGDVGAVKYCTESVFFHELLHIALSDDKYGNSIKDKEFLSPGRPNPDQSAYSVEDCELKLFDYPIKTTPCQAYPAYLKPAGYNEYKNPNDQFDTCVCCEKKK